MLWYSELTICIWLSFYELQIKIEYGPFASSSFWSLLLKSHSISRILTLLLFLSVQKTIRNFIFIYDQVTSDPDVLNYIQSYCSCADSPFLYPPAGYVVTGDLACITDKGLRSLFKKGPKYRLPSRIDYTKCYFQIFKCVSFWLHGCCV